MLQQELCRYVKCIQIIESLFVYGLWFSVLYVNNSICRPYYTHINAVCYGLYKNHSVRRLFGGSAVGLIANHVTICGTNYLHGFVRLE